MSWTSENNHTFPTMSDTANSSHIFSAYSPTRRLLQQMVSVLSISDGIIFYCTNSQIALQGIDMVEKAW